MGKIRKIISQKLSDTFEFPQDVTGGISTLAITGNNEISINECGYIIKYEDGELFLQLCDCVLKIFGDNLMLKTYFGNTMLVQGNICRIEFEE